MIITRFHDVEKMDITVEFLTPTFLGGADRQGELRSPPFKNLLRQWWRVVKGDLAVDELRQREGQLFGTVLGDNETTSSKVRISIVPNQEFKVIDAPFQFGATHHPEVGNNGMNVQNALYLGFGPVTYHHGHMLFRRYVAAGSRASLSLVFPRTYRNEIVSTLQYADIFGTIGSRCRNGYGSMALSSEGFDMIGFADIPSYDMQAIIENNKEYPNRFGSDQRGLLAWDSAPFDQWTQAMQLLAGTYLRVRTAIPIAGNGVQERHALGYPVTHHNVNDWGGNLGRMPSQLRLMVKRNQRNQLVARILHLPHRLPKRWPNNFSSQADVWRQVHQFLDGQNEFHRIGGAA